MAESDNRPNNGYDNGWFRDCNNGADVKRWYYRFMFRICLS